MLCPHCNQQLPWWNLLRFARGGSLRCVKCRQPFWLDYEDFNKRFASWHLLVFVFGGLWGIFAVFAVTFRLPYSANLFLLFLVVVCVVSFVLTLKTRTLTEPSEGVKRKQRHLRLGGLMGGVYFGGILINRDLTPYLIPFLVLSLIFFCLGFSSSKRQVRKST